MHQSGNFYRPVKLRFAQNLNLFHVADVRSIVQTKGDK